ncbi:hypothetical protein [Rummeliibacillus pycnus]
MNSIIATVKGLIFRNGQLHRVKREELGALTQETVEGVQIDKAF